MEKKIIAPEKKHEYNQKFYQKNKDKKFTCEICNKTMTELSQKRHMTTKAHLIKENKLQLDNFKQQSLLLIDVLKKQPELVNEFLLLQHQNKLKWLESLKENNNIEIISHTV